MRQLERKLHSNEAQFASLADTAIDGFVIAHTDGQIQWVNRAMGNLFGYDRAEEMIGRNLDMLMPALRRRATTAILPLTAKVPRRA